MPGTPEKITIQRESNRQIQAWLNKLDSANRQIVVLRYWYDLSYEEIAQVLGATVGAIKSRLHRAREVIVRQVEPKTCGPGVA